MTASRELSDLLPTVEKAARAALVECAAAGLNPLITCTYRSGEEQNRLYAIGRTVPGKKVTNARAGQSSHQWRVALDLVPMVNGKPEWTGKHSDWNAIAKIFIKHGFEWAGNWKRFRELPHFQMTKGHPLSYFQKGGKI